VDPATPRVMTLPTWVVAGNDTTHPRQVGEALVAGSPNFTRALDHRATPTPARFTLAHPRRDRLATVTGYTGVARRPGPQARAGEDLMALLHRIGGGA